MLSVSRPQLRHSILCRKCEVDIFAVGFVSRLLHTSMIDATNLFRHALKLISMRSEVFPLKNLVIKHFRTQSGVGQEFSGRYPILLFKFVDQRLNFKQSEDLFTNGGHICLQLRACHRRYAYMLLSSNLFTSI